MIVLTIIRKPNIIKARESRSVIEREFVLGAIYAPSCAPSITPLPITSAGVIKILPKRECVATPKADETARTK